MRWQYHEKTENIPNLGEGQREKGFENCSTYHWPSIFWIDEQSKRHYNGIKLDIKLAKWWRSKRKCILKLVDLA